MDWYVDSSDRSSITWLRREVADYLTRHAAPGSDIDGAVLAFSELVNNAAEHASGPVWVSIDWSERQPTLWVHDLGPQFALASLEMPDPSEPRGRGLPIAADIAVQLEIKAKAGGGSAVRSVLPVERTVEADIDPPLSSHGVIPDLEEATIDGFGRESFLRALVVQLAQEMERLHGPGVAQTVVAQVGTDIGSRMEEEFRMARKVSGDMTPQQVADCYVRLKHAIDGDFYVIEATQDRIVLGNRQCPFGDVVRHAPALCRMTSSVFGGIGARNFGESAVVLEQRIAVGDPECRVIVNLRPDANTPGHRYKAREEV